MDFAAILDQARDAWTRVEAFVLATPELGGVGLAVAMILAGGAIVFLGRALFEALRTASRAAKAASIRRTTDFGARVLVIKGGSRRLQMIDKFLRTTVDRHLADYMFGGPFRVISYPGPLSTDAQAFMLLKKTEADLVLWSDVPRGTRGVVRIASRPGNPFEKQRPVMTLSMPRDRLAWNEPLARALAYAAAKQFRPALGRPQDFRSERLQPVVERLINILDQNPKADPRLLAEMVDDVSAGALQLAFAGDDGWLDRSVELARATLAEINRSEATDRWIASKITLGRALRLRAERRFDPVMLREAISHLTDALDALRTEPRFKLAESAAQAITEAQKLLGARRKFSISGGGI